MIFKLQGDAPSWGLDPPKVCAHVHGRATGAAEWAGVDSERRHFDTFSFERFKYYGLTVGVATREKRKEPVSGGITPFRSADGNPT
jgi:hypothetical protein